MGEGEKDATIDATALDIPGPASADPSGGRWVLADRYEIQALVGAGGMGTVYRARDRELDEIVALKMLKRRVAVTAGLLERFRREVKLARRVTHRNVARMFDIGEHAGGKFLTMEYVDGQPLSAVLAKQGRLKVAEVVRIGLELCDGLDAAHAASVLHRDLKPENVLLARDGRVVITDFGIARALVTSEAVRSHDAIVGTPAYMAPEQLEGSADLDARTDLYAVGTMFFELLSGRTPWPDGSAIAMAMARLTKPPPDLREVLPLVAEPIAALVKRCMSRDRAGRFGSARELREALASLVPPAESSQSIAAPRTGAHVETRTTLAVLPIANLGASEDEYLAGTITEDLIDLLSAVPGLSVRPRGVAVRAAGPNVDPRELGRVLGVDVVVHGTVARARTDAVVDVALRVLTVEDGFQLWAGRFERDANEMVSVGDEAADAIARALSSKAQGAHRPLPTAPEAHDLWLRGRHVYALGWHDEHGDAARLLGKAHALAPDDARIAASYARALAREYGVYSRGEAMARAAQDAAEKALATDARSAEARLALAMLALYRGSPAAAAASLRHASEIAPDDPETLEGLGRLLAEVGPLERAAVHLEAALAKEPSLPLARHTLVRVRALLGDSDLADATLGPAPARLEELVPHTLLRARLLLWRADESTAAEAARAAQRIPEGSKRRLIDAYLGVVARGKLVDVDRAALAEEFAAGPSVTQARAAFNAQARAEIHLVANEIDEALAALADADTNGLIDVEWLTRCPLLAAIADRPEMRAVMRSTSLRAQRVREALGS